MPHQNAQMYFFALVERAFGEGQSGIKRAVATFLPPSGKNGASDIAWEEVRDSIFAGFAALCIRIKHVFRSLMLVKPPVDPQNTMR